jgi:hypothetical protein
MPKQKKPPDDDPGLPNKKPKVKAADIDALIKKELGILKEAYGDSFPFIDWTDKQTKRYFAVEAGLLQSDDDPTKSGCFSRSFLRMKLSEHVDTEILKQCNHNLLIQKCEELGILQKGEAEPAYSTRTLKCYLWTILDRRHGTLRLKLKEYAAVCSEIAIRGSIIANLVFGYAIRENRMKEMFDLIQSVDTVRYMILPEFFKRAALPSIVTDVLSEYSQAILQVPAWEHVMSRSGWDNGLKYIAGKYLTCLRNHILVHSAKRCRTRLSKVCDDPKAAIRCFFDYTEARADTLSLDDRDYVDQLRGFFGGNLGELKVPDSLTWDMLQLHVLLLQNGTKASALPVVSWTRGHHRACERVFGHLCAAIQQPQLSFQTVFGDISARLRQTRRIKRKKQRSRMRGRAHAPKRKSIRYSWLRLRGGSEVGTIETDGCAVSVTLRTPIPPRMTPPEEKLTAKEYVLRQQSAFRKEIHEMGEENVCGGIDLGRANFYSISFKHKKSGEDGVRIPNIQFTRPEWLRMIGERQRRQFLKEKYSTPEIKSFLRDVSNTRKKTVDGFLLYARSVKEHRRTLITKFLWDDEMCLKRMYWFRKRRSAMHHLVNRIFDHVGRRVGKQVPLALGSGNGSFGGGACKGERSSVPLKEMMQTIRGSFARMRRSGAYSSVLDEYNTTKMCCEHHQETSKHYSKGRRGKLKKRANRNVRCCAHCVRGNNSRGFVDRDGNAGKNHLLILECILSERDRPDYLSRPRAP